MALPNWHCTVTLRRLKHAAQMDDNEQNKSTLIADPLVQDVRYDLNQTYYNNLSRPILQG